MARQSSVGTRLAIPYEWSEGELVSLRPLASDDLPAIDEWGRDPEIIALMGRTSAQETTYEWFDRIAGDRAYRAMAIEAKDGTLIGDVVLAEINWRSRTAEVRICIGRKEYWGAGYGSDALRLVLRLAYEAMAMTSVYLRVFVKNERAIRCYDRCGFRRMGILAPSRRREDSSKVLLMSLSRERWERLQGRSYAASV